MSYPLGDVRAAERGHVGNLKVVVLRGDGGFYPIRVRSGMGMSLRPDGRRDPGERR